MTTQIQKQCPYCNHNDTCLIIRGVTQIMQQHFKIETQPFQPNQLAEICKQYQSKTTIETLLNTIEENGDNNQHET